MKLTIEISERTAALLWYFDGPLEHGKPAADEELAFLAAQRLWGWTEQRLAGEGIHSSFAISKFVSERPTPQ